MLPHNHQLFGCGVPTRLSGLRMGLLLHIRYLHEVDCFCFIFSFFLLFLLAHPLILHYQKKEKIEYMISCFSSLWHVGGEKKERKKNTAKKTVPSTMHLKSSMVSLAYVSPNLMFNFSL